MILITGASRGIGRYLAEQYCKLKERVEGTAYTSAIEGHSENINLARVEVSNRWLVTKWIMDIKPKEHLTLINCAGINYNTFAHKADPDQWRKVIEVNLIGTFNVINAVLPYMRANNFGRIINLSSVVAEKGIPGTSAYAASKAGLNGMVKSIAAENGKYGITINNICLGYFGIGMISEVPEAILEQIKGQIPCGELGDPMQIFNLVETIRQNPYINGANINIDGGIA